MRRVATVSRFESELECDCKNLVRNNVGEGRGLGASGNFLDSMGTNVLHILSRKGQQTLNFDFDQKDDQFRF